VHVDERSRNANVPRAGRGHGDRSDNAMRALIVDDSRAMRTILARMLHGVGYEVFEAENGQDGLEILRSQSPLKLVLVDWNMPVMDGIDFIRAVRTELGDRDLPIMMVTTESETNQVVRALAAGANEYLMKPFTESGLIDKLSILGAVPEPCGESGS
jgi:two-component system chemotaxis response regulator CheY